MLIRKPSDIRASDITPESLYRRRRELLKGSRGSNEITVFVTRHRGGQIAMLAQPVRPGTTGA